MKSRTIIPALLVCCGLALSGCTLFEDKIQKFSVDPVVAVKKDKDEKIAVIDLDKFPSKNTAYYKTPNQENRNSLQEAIITRSVVACSDFRKRLYALHAARKIFFQGASLLLSGAAAVVGGEAAQILAAVSAGALGIDETIDAHALQNAAISAVLNTITTERDGALTAMRQKQTRTIKKYSMEAAVGDAIRYNKLCSLTEAISALNNAVQKKNLNANTIKQIRISNLRIRLEGVQERRAQIVATRGLEAPGVKSLDARVTSLQADLKNLLKATTEEVVKGIVAPAENP